ncbi:M17 family metallopeptidase [Radiobacillus sp. PE A8.2]|uniref:M17 family metallopeptidase n=1 Tax=Radiobacillus sp. PE A8.2 TaxID=3380349 RepID=UPI0038909232
MDAKVRFFKEKNNLPEKLNRRCTLTFGEMFHCYDVFIDEVYLCYAQYEDIRRQDWVSLGEQCYTFVENKAITNIELDEKDCEQIDIKAFLEGFYKSNYRFDKYHSDKDKESITIKIPDKFKEASSHAKTIAEAVHVARDICNEPANVLYPGSYATYLDRLFKNTNVEVNIIPSEDLEKEGFYAVNTVGRGSKYEPCVAVLTLKTNDEEPIALVGKGVTFDAGGVNVKTGAAIAEMKMDLGGAAAVTGAMKLLADMDIACHVIAVLPLIVNVSGSHAYLPSDVIRYKNGTTVEVGNTDAEGRLIIADALVYVQQLGVNRIIDIATLTGNVGQALGLKMAAVFSNDINISYKAYVYGQKSGDYVWPMPLEKDYKRYLKSQVADISNMSNSSFAGSITAALFIEHFVEAKTKWIHIDMANTSKFFPDADAGASGFGTKILYELVTAKEEIWND